MTFSAYKLVHSGRFLTTYTNFDNCCLRYSDVRKKMHIYILCPKLLLWNFLQISQLSTRSGAHKLLRRFFGLFTIFDRNFLKIVAPPSDGNKKCLAVLKGQLLLKNAETERKSTHKQEAIAVQSISH